jgi:rare lipoprotein A
VVPGPDRSGYSPTAMDGTTAHLRRKRMRALAGLGAALMLTAPAGGPALADTGAATGKDTTPLAAQYAVPTAAMIRIAPTVSSVETIALDPPAMPEEPAMRALGNGVASYYGRRFHGRPTASGERFDMNGLTAAHRTLPFGSKVRVTNPRTGKSVVVRINDRGPFARKRTIDLSRAAAEEIGLVRAGHGQVELELFEE